MPARSYAQHCALARALDRVGDRWTLLIVRELLVAPRRWSQLRAGLPGMASNLLATRLSDLEADGLVRRRTAGAVVYELTDAGAALAEPVSALVRWGARWMDDRAEGDVLQPHWLVIALRALLRPGSGGACTLEVDGIFIALRDGAVTLGEAPGAPRLITDAGTALGLGAGRLPLDEALHVGRAAVRPAGEAARRSVAAALGA